jgi:hypothetical protein
MTCKGESDGVPVSHSIRAGAYANGYTFALYRISI